jgi:hypothetical protein
MSKKPHTTIAELIRRAELELMAGVIAEADDFGPEPMDELKERRADGTLAAAMIVQAIDRLTRAVNRQTAAINLANDNSLEDRDIFARETAGPAS